MGVPVVEADSDVHAFEFVLDQLDQGRRVGELVWDDFHGDTHARRRGSLDDGLETAPGRVGSILGR